MAEHRVMGPPGTGKTTFLSKQIRTAAQQFGSDRVMVASFTRAAAAELVGRDLPLDRDMIGTLHAHCYRQLQHPEIANDKKHIQDWNSSHPGYQLSAQDLNVDDPLEEGAFAGDADKILNEYNVYRARMIDRSLWTSRVLNFAKMWENWKRSRGVMDFTDLIEYCLNGVSAPPGKPDVIFLDEVQDFTKQELTLARKWGESVRNIVLAGDDDQAIYGWKGATPDAFLIPEIPVERIRILSQSYRVPRAVHEYSQQWIHNVKFRQEKAYQPRDFEGEVTNQRYGNWRNPDAIIEAALRDMDNGKSVMFLTTCSYMLKPIQAKLREHGVPFHNPYRRSRGDWNPLSPSKGVSTVERLLGFLRLDESAWGNLSRMWTVAEVKRWSEILKADGVFQRGGKGKILELPDENEEMPTSILADFLTDEAFNAIFDCNVEWLYAHALDNYKKVLSFPLEVGKHRGWNALREQPQLVIGTIHSVKGGEADCVYVFPDLSLQGFEEWDQPKRRDVIYRQFYVAFTRAREKLALCNADSMRAVTF